MLNNIAFYKVLFLYDYLVNVSDYRTLLYAGMGCGEGEALEYEEAMLSRRYTTRWGELLRIRD